MQEDPIDHDPLARNRRLQSLLEQLAEQGITQAQVARQLNMPASYVSDVKLGRKSVSEAFARFFCSEFGVGLDWLLDGVGPQTKPQFETQPVTGQAAQVVLPILSELIQGDPCSSPAWDGSRVELSGVAAAKAVRAHLPYVLRSPINDNLGRFLRNDLLLVDQCINESTEVGIFLDRKRLKIARRTNGEYRFVESDQAIGSKASRAGSCLGIVWAHL